MKVGKIYLHARCKFRIATSYAAEIVTLELLFSYNVVGDLYKKLY